MAWAPDRKRVLYCGGAYGQGATNDVWEYDLAANAWVLLYVPDQPMKENWKTAVVKDEVVQTPRGGPTSPTHLWSGLTYDSDRHMLLWVQSNEKLFMTVTNMKIPREQIYWGPQLWGYLPFEGRWEFQKGAAAELPSSLKRGANCAGLLEYVPELDGAVLSNPDNGTNIYSTRSKKWEFLDMKPSSGRESVSCYDSTNKLVIAHRGDEAGGKTSRAWSSTWHFKVAEKKWEKINVEGPPAHDKDTVLYHDPLSGHCLLHRIRAMELWAYDAKAPKWTKLEPSLAPPGPSGYRGDPAYFDPARNVFVMVRENGPWVYRYKRATEKR
jgi:hypothetical protein